MPQHATAPLATPNPAQRHVQSEFLRRWRRLWGKVADALMRSFGVVVHDVLGQCSPQAADSKQRQPAQALGLCRSDPALREGIEVGAVFRKRYSPDAALLEDVLPRCAVLG